MILPYDEQNQNFEIRIKNVIIDHANLHVFLACVYANCTKMKFLLQNLNVGPEMFSQFH